MYLLDWISLGLQVSRNADNHPAFFAVYNMESTEIIAFYQVYVPHNSQNFPLKMVLALKLFYIIQMTSNLWQNSSDELYSLFELFCDHFNVSGRNSLYMNFISTHSNNIHALEQLRSNKNKTSSFSQVNGITSMNCCRLAAAMQYLGRL